MFFSDLRISAKFESESRDQILLNVFSDHGPFPNDSKLIYTCKLILFNSEEGSVNIKRVIVIILALAVLSVAGCVSEESEYQDQNLSNYSDVSPEDYMTSDTGNASGTPEYDASGVCTYVVDGDTIDVSGMGRIRLVGVNTPERGEPGYREAKDFMKSMCLSRTVQLDIDDAKRHDKYGRVLAVVYVDGVNINRELLRRGYAEVMYIPPSEFNPYEWT